MFRLVKRFLQQRCLRKYSSTVPTGFLSLQQIRTVSVLVNVEDAQTMELLDEIVSWFRARNIKVSTHFFDFRKIAKDELLTTSIQNTLLKKELNWYGMPPAERAVNVDSDLFISLVRDSEFPNRFYSLCSRSRFKIGRCSWDNAPFDLTISAPESAGASQVFEEILNYLQKIQ